MVNKTWGMSQTGFDPVEQVQKVAALVWDVGSLEWVKMTQPGGGSGGAVTIADGADVAQGAKADAAWVSGDGTVVGILKAIASGNAMDLPNFDFASQSQTATQDVWTFKTGGSGGTTVATVTINYVDATKLVITDVTKT